MTKINNKNTTKNIKYTANKKHTVKKNTKHTANTSHTTTNLTTTDPIRTISNPNNTMRNPKTRDRDQANPQSPTAHISQSRITPLKNHNFSCISWNCNSISNKIETIKIFLEQERPDILALSEIKTTEIAANDLLYINGYNTHYKCRTAMGGGVAFLIKDTLVYNELILPTEFEDEIIGITLRIANRPIAIFNYYNPPDQDLNKELLNHIDTKFKEYLIMGDLNAKLKAYNYNNNKNGRILENSLLDIRAQVLNTNKKNEPTSYRTTNEKTSHSTLDYMIGTNLFSEFLDNFKILENSIINYHNNLYYHLPIRCKFKLEKDRIPKNNSNNKAYLYNKADWEGMAKEMDHLISQLKSNDLDSTNIDNLDLESDKLLNCINLAAKNNIPLAKNSTGRISNLPIHIAILINSKNYWWRKYNKTKNRQAKENMEHLRDTIELEIKIFKNENWQAFLSRLGKNPLSAIPFWKRINRLSNKKKPNSIPTLNKDNKELTTDKEKAEAFAEKLGFTFTEATSAKFDESHKKFVENYINKKKYDKLYSNKLPKHFTKKELDDGIKAMNKKGSPDQYNLSNKILNHISDQTKDALLNLFNRCVTELKIPRKWKESTITMIHKKEDKSNIQNYRPISITPCVMRLFERLLLARLKKHLDDNNILIKNQSGFRNGRSTKDNITFLTQKIFEAFNKKKGKHKLKRKVYATFYDIKGAFDSVWHAGLIFKLVKIKTPYYLLQIIINFLQGRSFTVKVGAYESKRRSITCGVPQGAVLSPTLFSIFINDMPMKYRKNKEYTFLFADDLNYILIFKRKNKSTEKMINDFNHKLEKWSNKWRLEFAPHKCNFMIFTRAKSGAQKITFKPQLYDNPIEEAVEIKYLGIRFDKYASFKYQVEHLRQRCYERIRIIKRISHKSWCLSTQTLVQVYKALVQSLLEYSAPLFSTLNKKNKESLQAIQTSALRIIFKKSKTFGNKNLLTLANEVPLETRLNELKNSYLDKAKANKNPIILDLINDYKEFKEIDSLKPKTTLCDTIHT